MNHDPVRTTSPKPTPAFPARRGSRRDSWRVSWRVVCAAGLALAAWPTAAGPGRDGHPANRPGFPGAGEGASPQRAPFRGPRGVGAPRPNFLPPGFRGVPARAPGPNTLPPRPPSIGPDGFIPRDAAGRPLDPRFGPEFGPAFDSRFPGLRRPEFEATQGDILSDAAREILRRAAANPRPVLVLGGARGVCPSGLVLLPNESALERLYGGPWYDARDDGPIVVAGAAPLPGTPGAPMVVGGVDPRLWAWWVVPPPPVAGPWSAGDPDALAQASPRPAPPPPLSESMAMLGLTVLPPPAVVEASGLGLDVEWDAELAWGLRLFAAGDAEQAAEAFGRRVAARPDDHAARRLLGLALLDASDPATGLRQIAEAYRGDPTLGASPLGPALFVPAGRSDDRLRLRTLMEKAVRLGGRGAEGAWLAAAMLAQAEGRDRVVGRVLDRAEGAGVDPVLLGGVLRGAGPAD